MTDKAVSALTSLTGANTATGDLLYIVDISEAAAADRSKKITIQELFDSVPAGTASAPAIAAQGDQNTGIYFPAADTVAISTGGTERNRTTSGGYFKASDTGAYLGASGAYHELRQTADLECLILQATNASYTNTALGIWAYRNTTNSSFYALSYYNQPANEFRFRVADSGNVTNTNNSYGAVSDEKLKQDIVDAGSQWDDIKGLRVRKFHYKADPTGPLQIGLIAQEAQTVSPGLIEEHPDYEEVEVQSVDADGNAVVDADGNPVMERQRNPLGTSTKVVKYSVLYMKAVKALQEAITRIEALETEVAALKAR